MAIAFSRYVDGTSSSSSATAVVSLTACSAGDLVFVLISRAATVAPTGYPTGWSSSNLIQSHASTYGVWLYSKVLALGENVSSTFTWAAAAKCLAHATVYTGATVASSAKGTFATASGTSVDCGTITSTKPWLAQFASGYSTAAKSYTALSGYTERRDRGGTAPDFWHVLEDTNNTWVSGACAPDFVYDSSLSCTYRGGMIVELEGGERTITTAATITGALSSNASIYPAVVYTSSLTGLSASTDYHVRAYATNAGGTSYGSEVDFTSGASATPTTMTSAATITGALSSSASITNTPPAIVVTTAATITGALSSSASLTIIPSNTVGAAATLTGPLVSSATLENTPPARTITSSATLTGPVVSSATIVNTPPAITMSAAATLTGPLASSAEVVVPLPVTLGTTVTLTGPLASGATIVNTPPAVTLTSTATITGSVASAATLVNTPPPSTISSSVTITGSLASSATLVNTPPAITVVTDAVLTGALASAAALVNTPPACTITTAATLTGALASSADLVNVASANTMSSSITLTGPLVSVAGLVNTPPPVTISSDATVTGAVVSSAAVEVVQPSITIETSATLTGALSSSSTVTAGTTYTSSLTGLTGNTTYHVRAYATTANGTAYGNELDFQTDTPPAVTLTSEATLTGPLSSSASLIQGVIIINAHLTITSDKPRSIEVESSNILLTGWLESSATLSTELLTFPATISATGAAAGCAMNAIQCKMELVKPSSDIHVRELDTFPVEVILSPAVPAGYLWMLGALDSSATNINLQAGVTDGVRTSWIQDSYRMNETEGHQPPGYYYQTQIHVRKWPEYSYYIWPYTVTGLTLTIYESEITAEVGVTGAAAGCNIEAYTTANRENSIDVTGAAAGADMYISQNKLTAEFADLPDGSVYQVGAPMHLVIDLSVVPGRGLADLDGNFGSEGWEEQLLFWIWWPATYSWKSADPFYWKIPAGVTHYETDIYPRQDWDKVPYAFVHGDTITWVVSHNIDSYRQELFGNYVYLETTYTDVDAPIAAAAAAPTVTAQAYNYGAEIGASGGAARVAATSETEFEHSMVIGCGAAKAGVQITANKVRYRRKQAEVERSGANRADAGREGVSPRGGIIASVTTKRAVQKKGAVDGFDNN